MSDQDLTQALQALVGHHARSVSRTFSYPPGSLIPTVKVCPICCGPMNAKYPLCYACNQRQTSFPNEVADIVAPLSYAARGKQELQQFYADLHQYKFDQPSAAAQTRLKALLLLFRTNHLHCLEAAIGLTVNAVITVPSGRNRANHPLPQITAALTAPVGQSPGIPVVPAQFVGQPRAGRPATTNPDDFAIRQPLTGHVLIVEDTWVKGNNAQSLAIQARRCGAQKVSIVVLARMLDYTYAETKTMVDTWANDARFDPRVCPVTGARH